MQEVPRARPSRTRLQGSEENWAGGKRTATITTGPRLTQGGLLGLWWPFRVAVSCSPMLAATGREPPLGRGLSSGLEGCLYTRWFMGKDVEETRQCLILQRRANDYFRPYREFWKTHYCLHLTPTTRGSERLASPSHLTLSFSSDCDDHEGKWQSHITKSLHK